MSSPGVVVLDRHELAIMGKLDWSFYEFMKTAAQERRAHDLFMRGLLLRSWEQYRVSAGGKSTEYRWAYKLSNAGVNALSSRAPSP